MPNKMERFTQRARRVLSLAQEEAEKFQHSYIGTEHLLLGLLREEGGVAGRVLRDLGLETQKVSELANRLTKATPRNLDSQLDLSPDTKRALELGVDEARRMGHHYIGTEHLLLGMVRQTDTVAVEILKQSGVSPEDVRRQVRRVLQESPTQARQSTEESSTQTVSPLVRSSEINEEAVLLLNNFDLIEIISGKIFTTTSNRFISGKLYAKLYYNLSAFAYQHDLGYVAPDNIIYVLLKQDTKIMQARVPDLSFIRKERLSGYNFGGVFSGSPDFAIEIVSRVKSLQSVLAKVRDFLTYGTEEAWVVYLEQQEIHVYRRDDSNSIRVYHEGDILDSVVFPGLALPVSDLFKQPG
jgi:Uma2 family endonuclease